MSTRRGVMLRAIAMDPQLHDLPAVRAAPVAAVSQRPIRTGSVYANARGSLK